MVGHTGIFDAAVKAVETLDECLGRIVAAIREVDGECLITADHGNVEQMSDASTGQAHTAHTCEPVPLVYVGAPQTAFSRRRNAGRRRAHAADADAAAGAEGDDRAIADRPVRARASHRVAQPLCSGAGRSLGLLGVDRHCRSQSMRR